jgi:hypothetical protein
MLRTPVVVAFFLAAALVGMMLRYTDMSGGVETFTLPADSPAPLDTVASPLSGTGTLMGSEAKPVPALPYDVACICLTESDKKGFASRFGNKSSM